MKLNGNKKIIAALSSVPILMGLYGAIDTFFVSKADFKTVETRVIDMREAIKRLEDNLLFEQGNIGPPRPLTENNDAS